MDEAGLTIIVQCTRLDRYDRPAWHHVLDLQGRERGVQPPEIGEVLDYCPNHGIAQLIWLIARCDEHGLRADTVRVAGIHAAWDDIGDVIGMRRKEAIDRRASDAHQPCPAVRRRSSDFFCRRTSGATDLVAGFSPWQKKKGDGAAAPARCCPRSTFRRRDSI